jgi:hypothetical protein
MFPPTDFRIWAYSARSSGFTLAGTPVMAVVAAGVVSEATVVAELDLEPEDGAFLGGLAAVADWVTAVEVGSIALTFMVGCLWLLIGVIGRDRLSLKALLERSRDSIVVSGSARLHRPRVRASGGMIARRGPHYGSELTWVQRPWQISHRAG